MTARPVSRPFPLDPLLRECAASSLRDLARQLDVDPGYLCRCLDRGLTERQADEWACRLGLHPLNVWGALWTDQVST